MTIIQNALKSISRSKARNILIGLIILSVTAASVIALSIKHSASDIIEIQENQFDIQGTLILDRNLLRSNYSGSNESMRTLIGLTEPESYESFKSGDYIMIENDVEKIEQELVIEDRGVEVITEKEAQVKDPQPKNEKNSLKNVLLKFREEKISSKYTVDSASLLSDRMVDLLVQSKPTSMDEFRIHIPQYLREKIDRNQMEYIEDVFLILED